MPVVAAAVAVVAAFFLAILRWLARASPMHCDLSIQHKLHLQVFCITPRLAANNDGFGNMLEDEIEKCHQDGDRFSRRVARLKTLELQVQSFNHHEKTLKKPEVQKQVVRERMAEAHSKRSEADSTWHVTQNALENSLRHKFAPLVKRTVLT